MLNERERHSTVTHFAILATFLHGVPNKICNSYVLGTPVTSPVTSANFPSDYPNNHCSVQTLEVEIGQRILIKFTDFFLEFSRPCSYDYVMIKDSDGTILMKQSCGHTMPRDIVSITNKADVIFKTDSKTTFK